MKRTCKICSKELPKKIEAGRPTDYCGIEHKQESRRRYRTAWMKSKRKSERVINEQLKDFYTPDNQH